MKPQTYSYITSTREYQDRPLYSKIEHFSPSDRTGNYIRGVNYDMVKITRTTLACKKKDDKDLVATYTEVILLSAITSLNQLFSTFMTSFHPAPVEGLY